LLAIPGKAAKVKQTIVIEDERIVEVRKGYSEPGEFEGEVTVIDLKDQFVMPGLMVKAGMPEMEVIKAATVNAADLLDMTSSIGTIEAGKYADIIAVGGSPLKNIEELLDVDFVMKGGRVYKD
jgi:imidazolonepropionase-like amidohydrolase